MNDTSSNNNPASGFDKNSYRIAKYLRCKYNGANGVPVYQVAWNSVVA